MNKNLMIILTVFVMIGCSGTVPSIGNEVDVQITEESNETAQQKEVSVETLDSKKSKNNSCFRQVYLLTEQIKFNNFIIHSL